MHNIPKDRRWLDLCVAENNFIRHRAIHYEKCLKFIIKHSNMTYVKNIEIK